MRTLAVILLASTGLGCTPGSLQAGPGSSLEINPALISVTGSVFNSEDNVGVVRFGLLGI